MDGYESKMPLLYQIDEGDEELPNQANHQNPTTASISFAPAPASTNATLATLEQNSPSDGPTFLKDPSPDDSLDTTLATVEQNSPSSEPAFLKGSSPDDSLDDTMRISGIPISPFVTRRNPKAHVSPAYIDEAHRQFSNPISYLGGPRLEPRNRNSVDSVLSID